jgi:hypothetical protein
MDKREKGIMDNKNYQHFSFKELLNAQQNIGSEAPPQEIAGLQAVISAHPNNP